MRLAALTPHFVWEDALGYAMTHGRVRWTGALLLADGLELAVKKTQAMRLGAAGLEVRTERYAYQLLRPAAGEGRRGVFRYDNFHDHPNHPDAHHCHRYQDDGTQIEPPEYIGAAGWPTLGDVLDEAFRWWCDHLQPPAPR